MKKLLAVLLFAGVAAAARAQSWTPYYLGWMPYSGGNVVPSGSVTSVALSCVPEMTCSGSPITSSGVLAQSWASTTSGYFFARDFTGAGVPSLQALTITDGQCLGRTGTAWASKACSGGGSTPTGTGFAFVTSGSYDAASKGAADAASFLGIETQYIYCRDEMTGASGECSSAQSSGTNSSASSNLNDPGSADGGTSKPFGVKILTTGDTTTGRAAQIMSNSTDNGIGYCTAGAGEYYAAVALEDLSAVAQEYDIWIGLLREISTQPTYGIYFKYDRDGTSTNWYACSASASSRTCTDTSVAVAEDTWVKFRITWDSTCANATMYINGSSVATKNATMPTAGITPGVAMLKSAGTTARRAFVDYQVYYQKLTSAR